MRGAREHSGWPEALRFRRQPVEFFDGDSEHPGIAADFIQRGQAIEYIESSVLDALRHRRTGELLEPHDELGLPIAPNLEQENCAHEVEKIVRQVEAMPFGARDGFIDVTHIIRLDLSCFGYDVGPVNREERNHFAHRLVNVVPHEIAEPAVSFADIHKKGSELVHVAAESLSRQLLFSGSDDFPQIGGLACEFRIEIGQRFLAGRVDKQSTCAEQEIVSARARDRPGFAQLFAGLQNLLGDNPGILRRRVQALKVSLGISQPVRVVDPHAVENSATKPAERQAVGKLKNTFILHSQTGY